MTTGIQQTLEGMLCCICLNLNDEGSLCSDCEERNMHECSNHCGESGLLGDLLTTEQFHRADRQGLSIVELMQVTDDEGLYCNDCILYCEHCNESYSDEDNRNDCCYNYSSVIHNYSYVPFFYFYRMVEGQPRPSYQVPGVLYMGVEIEINKFAHISEAFIDSMEPDSKDFVYLKEDGSIGPDGAELVTMPATIDAFKEVFPFDRLDWARKMGARSFYYGNCGFHIHVARSAFTATHMWKFVKFQLNNPKLCQRVAQREESSYATWYYDDYDKAGLPEFVKGKRFNGRRYLAINFQNKQTVELRYFKGNILRSAIMKNLEFVQSIYDYTKTLSAGDVMRGALTEESYMDWLFETDEYPNLIHFLSNTENKESE